MAGHRRGHPAPPAADRRAGGGLRPGVKVNPPLRTEADVAELRRALADGTIDCVATDHAPHPVEAKESEWAEAAFA